MEGEDSSPVRGALHEPAALPIESAEPTSSRDSSSWYPHRVLLPGSLLSPNPREDSVSALFGGYQICCHGGRTSSDIPMALRPNRWRVSDCCYGGRRSCGRDTIGLSFPNRLIGIRSLRWSKYILVELGCPHRSYSTFLFYIRSF